MNRLVRSILVALPFLLLAYAVVASELLSVEEMVEKLAPPPATRSFDFTRGVQIEGKDEAAPSLNLYINFEYDSAELKQDSLILLDRLAAALKDGRLADHRFLIAGHTDAAGSEAYNQGLSERRAAAVKSYLVNTHDVAAARLVGKGFGETRLLNPEKPREGSNRRVQIVTLKGDQDGEAPDPIASEKKEEKSTTSPTPPEMSKTGCCESVERNQAHNQHCPVGGVHRTVSKHHLLQIRRSADE